MKLVRLEAAAVLVALLGYCVPFAAFGADASWLLGRWELKHDTDGSPKDYLEFGEGAQVTSISQAGRRTEGLYRVGGDVVDASFPLANGRTLKLHMLINKKHQLSIRSERTGGVAVYERVSP